MTVEISNANEASVLVDATRLKAFVQAVYEHVELPSIDAALLADTLVQADLWGHQSHGVLRTPWYFERAKRGVMLPKPHIEVLRDKGAVAVLDAHEGVGQVTAKRMMELGIAKAKAHGVASITVRNSNHFGTLMYFTKMATDAGCIAFLTSNGGPAMAPWGGAKTKLIGTNPWSIAAPTATSNSATSIAMADSAVSHAGSPPILLDMANTGVARGKIYLAKQRGEPIPLGWALDAQGAPTTDPSAAIEGMILPMAQHKGYAIATLMDVMAGVLSGAQFLDGVNSPYHFDKPSGAGHFLAVYDIEAFMDLPEYEQRMQAFVSKIKSHPKAQGVDEIFYPGEIEARADLRQRKNGIELPMDTWNDLKPLAAEVGCVALLDAALA